MTLEEHLRTILGNQVLTIAKLAAEIDALKEQLAHPHAPAPDNGPPAP